jgi:hypothetical protein
MIGTTFLQGDFISTGNDYTIKSVSGFDWFRVYNWTTTNAGIVASTGIEWYWHKNMDANDGIVKGWSAGGVYLQGTLSALNCGGFTLVDSSIQTVNAPVAVVDATNAVAPIVQVASTAGMSDGMIVRLVGGNQNNLSGLDFSIIIDDATHFHLANPLATAPGVASGACFYRLIARNVDEYNRFYPARRVICNITQAAAGVVTTMVDHSLTTGQQVRINVSDVCGMTELNGQLVTVTVINASTFSINVDTTGYTAFAFPTIAIPAFTPAEMVPVGIAMAYNTTITAALRNNEFTGITLSATNGGGLQWAPAGAIGDEIHWEGGTSSN